MVDLAQMKRWALPSKPSKKAMPPEDDETEVDSGEKVWTGLSSKEVEALDDTAIDKFDEWMAENLSSLRETLIELAGALAESNPKLIRHAKKELTTVSQEEEGEGLTDAQIEVLIDLLEMEIDDEGYEAGSDELRRAAVRAVAMARSQDTEEEGEEDTSMGEGEEEEEAPKAPAKKAPKALGGRR